MTRTCALLAMARSRPWLSGIMRGPGTTRPNRVLSTLSEELGRRASHPENGNQLQIRGAPATLGTAYWTGRYVSPTARVGKYPQRRALSSETDDSNALPADEKVTAMEYVDEGVEESGTDPAPPRERYMVTVDGLSYGSSQSSVESFFVDAGCPPLSIYMPLRVDTSFRSGQNKGVAFVDFSTEEDMRKAIALTGNRIDDRWLNIVRRRIALDECKSVLVKGVRGLPTSVLEEFFASNVGAPECVVAQPEMLITQGVAVVDFPTAEMAHRALELDGKMLSERWLDVMLNVQTTAKSLTPSESGGLEKGRAQDDYVFNNIPEVEGSVPLLVRGFSFETPDEEIRQVFLDLGIQEGEIVGFHVPKYGDMTSNRGFALLCLKGNDAVNKALAAKGTYIGTRWIDVSYWSKNGASKFQSAERTPEMLMKRYPNLPCIRVEGLPFSMSSEDIRECFIELGLLADSIEELSVPKFRNTTNNTGVCYFIINNEEMYYHILRLSGSQVGSRWVKVSDISITE